MSSSSCLASSSFKRLVVLFVITPRSIAAADERSVYGYCVTNEEDELIYSPVGSFFASHILWHAKDVADYMRVHGYTYGDADRNPALDKNSENPEKLVSCDRFCGWVLYEAGYVAHQPPCKGLPLYFSPNLEEYLIASGSRCGSWRTYSRHHRSGTPRGQRTPDPTRNRRGG